MYKSRDELTWTALIGGYAQKGRGRDALDHFECMVQEGITPDAVTYICVLKACGGVGAADKGEIIHNEIAKRGLLETDVILGNALVDMYAKCGALAKAQQTLEELPVRNAISWNALISGYTRHGNGEQALECFEMMQADGLFPDAVTFLCLFKACGSIGATGKGTKIHDVAAKQGLLEHDIALGNALVDMYVKCGALAKAAQVLQELTVRDAISWSSLIVGYANHGEGEQAMVCFEQMQSEGLSPDAVTFVCILKACSSLRKVEKGEKVHVQIAKEGLPAGDDTVLGNTLVDMYSKCGALSKAWRVLEELLVRDVISWNAIMIGYVNEGQNDRALKCFKEMQGEGLSPDEVTLSCLLKICGTIGAVKQGEKIHEEIAKQGLKDVLLGNAIADMHAKCGAVEKARQVIEELPIRDVVSWNILVASYVQKGDNEQALKCLGRMEGEGIAPNAVTFLSILKACGSKGEVGQVERAHVGIVKQGLLEDEIVLGNALVDTYAKCGAIMKAERVHDKLPVRDIISWNTLIAGYVQHGEDLKALSSLERMRHEGLCPDTVTFSCILKACGNVGDPQKGGEVHNEIAKQGLLGNDDVLGMALVDMYIMCRDLAKGRRVLEELHLQSLRAWNALIGGYAKGGECEQALKVFEAMRREGFSPDAVTFVFILNACSIIGVADQGDKIYDEIARHGLLACDIQLGNALVDMYAKCGAFSKARRVLEELPIRDVVSWNALISAYSQQGEVEQAMSCLEGLWQEGLAPDAVTFACFLKACGNVAAAEWGERFCQEVAKQGLLENDIVLGMTLMDMYAKCGDLERAARVLEELPMRTVTSWNILMAGYAQECKGGQALKCFEWMQCEGLSPDASTFASVLGACGRSGLIENAQRVFAYMSTLYDSEPSIEHYTCITDLLARTGHLDEAIKVINKMEFSDHGVWSALLAACGKWGDVTMGTWAFGCALKPMPRV